jgi:AraC family transcriptional regulator
MRPADEAAQLEARAVRRAVDHKGLHAFEAAYAPGTVLPEHDHAAPFFTYVLHGSYVERAGQVARDCKRGAVVLHHGGESHANLVGPSGTASLNSEIACDLWYDLPRGLARDSRVVGRVLTGDVEWLAMAVWREFHHDDIASALGMHESIARLLAAVLDASTRETAASVHRLDACADYICDHLDTPPSLSVAAALLGVHPMHAARLFRRRFGCSMAEFGRRRRVAWACDRLAEENVTIANIAVRAGFADHAHFTRTFRRITGCAPRWYRARVLNVRMVGLCATQRAS